MSHGHYYAMQMPQLASFAWLFSMLRFMKIISLKKCLRKTRKHYLDHIKQYL